jgi:hypothetical protein
MADAVLQSLIRICSKLLADSSKAIHPSSEVEQASVRVEHVLGL